MTTHLIDAAALAAQLADSDCLVVDCRADLLDYGWGLRHYQAGHIPGAVHASLATDLSGPAGPTTGRHPLPSAEQFAATLSRWGVTPATRVIAYDQGPGPYAARLWWLLRAVGHNAVRVLDGGWAAWTSAALPVQTDIDSRAASIVAVRALSGWVDADVVLAAARDGSARVVDARGADRYAGQNETIDPVAGHIPTAVNHPFTANLGSDGHFKTPQQLREQWLVRLGAFAPTQMLASCGSGITACHNLLALSQAGLEGGRLYAGSWSHWIRDPHRPIATGSEPGSL